MQNNQMIKQELLQYVARLLEENPLNHQNQEAARHDIAALLIEQALNLSVNQDQTRALYVLKPLYKAILLMIKERLNEIEACEMKLDSIKQLKDDYNYTVIVLEKIIANL